MAVRGSGPSRRSHTKSRKGCKTCKRRHIRCDESFPQCRNCTKHHVRCDYQDGMPDSDSISTTSSVQTSPTPTPTVDDGTAPHFFSANAAYTDLGLPAPLHAMGPDPELLQNLLNIADTLDSKGASALTPWVSMIRRHLAHAPSYPYLLEALKAFSAGQLAWKTEEASYRDAALSHASTALAGLHDAVGQFDKSNSDAVLVTAMLLATQSRDWGSWSSLLGGLQSITAAIGAWENESVYADMVRHMNTMFMAQEEQPQETGVTDQERSEILRRIQFSLQQLRPYLLERPMELHWIGHFIDLIHRLQTTAPAKTVEDGFNHLYVLRKWVFWLPVLLLSEGHVDILKLAVLAHLFAMPLLLGPTFPRLGANMCGYAASSPLASVLSRMPGTHAQLPIYSEAEIAMFMQLPQSALDEFNTRNPWSPTRPQPSVQIPDISMYPSEEFHVPGNLSPAFTPANFAPAHSRASSAASTFLSVPTPSPGYVAPIGFTQNFSTWGTFPSPSIPTVDFFGDDDLSFGDDDKHLPGPFGGGFLQP